MPKASALLDAVLRGDATAVADALRAGAAPDEVDRGGRTALANSAIDGREDIAVLLLDAGAEPGSSDRMGWTPLHFAAQEGHVSLARLLLDRGADVDARNSFGNTPLSNAVFAFRGDGALIRLLRERGADADLANNTLGWQWTAGCGADAAPYFRVFNPVLQTERFDPQRTYVRRWLPELAALPDKWVHRPFDAPAEVLAAAGVQLGVTYPLPLVELQASRTAALAGYARIRGER